MPTPTTQERHTVIGKNWTEHEWGQRDSGYSLHLTVEDAEQYAQKETSQQFRPEYGVFAVSVTQEIFRQLQQAIEEGELGIGGIVPSRLQPGITNVVDKLR